MKGNATIFHSSSKSAMLSRTKDSVLQRSCFKWPTDLDHRVVKDLCNFVELRANWERQVGRS